GSYPCLQIRIDGSCTQETCTQIEANQQPNHIKSQRQIVAPTQAKNEFYPASGNFKDAHTARLSASSVRDSVSWRSATLNRNEKTRLTASSRAAANRRPSIGLAAPIGLAGLIPAFVSPPISGVASPVTNAERAMAAASSSGKGR